MNHHDSGEITKYGLKER